MPTQSNHHNTTHELIYDIQLFFSILSLHISLPRNFCNIPDYIDGLATYKYIAILCNLKGPHQYKWGSGSPGWSSKSIYLVSSVNLMKSTHQFNVESCMVIQRKLYGLILGMGGIISYRIGKNVLQFLLIFAHNLVEFNQVSRCTYYFPTLHGVSQGTVARSREN